MERKKIKNYAEKLFWKIIFKSLFLYLYFEDNAMFVSLYRCFIPLLSSVTDMILPVSSHIYVLNLLSY